MLSADLLQPLIYSQNLPSKTKAVKKRIDANLNNKCAVSVIFNRDIDALWGVAKLTFGGEREIRTRDKVAPVPPFQGGDLNRSSSSPSVLL